VLAWAPAALPASDVAGARVLEVGSYDVNGSVRPLVEAHGPASYLGVDQSGGPRVDKVVSCYDLVDTFGPDAFDIVISTEMLEHVDDWQRAVAELAGVAADLLVITTRSKGFPYHPFPGDFWRYSIGTMENIVDGIGFVGTVENDPECPGVFVKARKRNPWPGVDTLALEVAGVTGV
jgi:hypothetical protein